jgi:cell wall integrity and stress response component
MTTLAPTVQTVTAGGTIQTVTVTPTVPVGAANSNGVSPSSNGLSTGSAVGLAVGVVALVAIVLGALLFFCLRRRRRQEEPNDMPSPWRNSSAGMMSITPRTDMSDKVSGGRPVPDNWETDELGRRRSRLMPVDPRMNFGTGIYAREENVSHDSINTVRDDQDYSRRVHEPPKVLRATNPDPSED